MQTILTLAAAAAIKAAAILALAGLVTATWRSASASARHLVWTAAVASALVLPIAGVAIATMGGPRIPISIWNPVVTMEADIAPEPTVATPPDESFAPFVPTIESTPVEPIVAAENPVTTPVDVRIELPVLAAIVAPSIGGAILTDWRKSAILLWAVGVLLALAPLMLALVRVRLLSRRAKALTESRWLRLIEETPAIRHLASRVRVLESTETSMPMTWGVLRPTLLVPANAERWPDWQCRNVLLHELAHVERRDCLTQLVAQIACAVYWFNPLAWVAAHRMRVERELACDDCVISAGSVASDYAENLLDVARSLRIPSYTSQTAIAMARPSQLSGRLLAVLDTRRNRRSVSRRLFAGASFAALAVVLPLASITPRDADAAVSEMPPQRMPLVSHDASVVAGEPAAELVRAFPLAPIAIVQAAQVPAIDLATSLAGVTTPLISVFSAKPANLVGRVLPVLPALGLQNPVVCWGEGKDGKTSTSIQDNSSHSGSSWTMRYSRDGCSLELRAEGKFTLRGDLSDVESIASGGWFRVEERDGRTTRRIEIRPAGNGLEHIYYVNGDRATYDANARAWLAEMLLAVERRTAFAASTRVPQLYKSGGLNRVLAEIALMPGAYGKSKYYGTLLDMEIALDANTLNEVVRHVSNDLVSSDYYMSEVLGKLASQQSANESTWRIFAEAAGRMKSDYYKATILKKVLNSGRLNSETVGVLLRSASGIESDYYLTDLLKSVAGKYALNNDTRGVYVEALGRIESDYYRSELLRSINTEDKWDERTTAFILTSVSGIKSDYYKSESLKSLVGANHVNNWPAFFSAAAAIDSDHYKKETLNAALRRNPLTREIAAGVISVASRMKSDYEAAEVLSSVARSYRIDEELRPAYEKAVDSIDSDYYRGSALSALRRSMTR